MLVRIARDTEPTIKLHGGVEVRKALGSVRVVMMAEAGLSCRLTAIVDLYSWVPAGKGEMVAKSAHPPSWLVKAVLEDNVYRGVRQLRGVAETPFPRPDGTLAMEPGYDETTGVYYAPTVAIEPIPESPTRDDARAAAKLLLALVEQFPFDGEENKAVWLAALLTVIARPAISKAVPGTAFTANKAGTGKGKVIDCIGIIATGRAIRPPDIHATRRRPRRSRRHSPWPGPRSSTWTISRKGGSTAAGPSTRP